MVFLIFLTDAPIKYSKYVFLTIVNIKINLVKSFLLQSAEFLVVL